MEQIREEEVSAGESRRGEEQILYVVVLYNQDIKESNAYKTFLHNCKNVYIYDNSKIGIDETTLPEGWVYVHDPSNSGLSKAYNQGARYAEKAGFKWMLITDQDTIYEDGAEERYEKLIKEYPEEKIFIPLVKVDNNLYLSPVKKKLYFCTLSNEPMSGMITLRECGIINSGLLINIDAFIACGGYNEKVFLDFSDFQFIDRLSGVVSKGRVTNEVLFQNFSGMTDDTQKQNSRFVLFCNSLKGFEKDTVKKKIGLPLAVLKRCVSLCVKQKSLNPLGIMLREYCGHSSAKQDKC